MAAVHFFPRLCFFASFKLSLLMAVYVSLLVFAEDLEPGSPSERLKEALSYRDKFESLYLVSHCFQYVVF